MKKTIIGLAIAASVLAAPVAADGPKTSLRPVARAAVELTEPMISTNSPARLRPVLRPQDLAPLVWLRAALPWKAPITSDDLAANTDGVAVYPASMGRSRSLRPQMRPDVIVEKALARRRELRRGMVCGDRGLQGDNVGYVPGKFDGCGIRDAVRLRSVEGIPLSQAALMDCSTAQALQTWVQRSLIPGVGNSGGGVSQIRVAAHYACRPRNNQPGAKISEHGRGRAIDISGIRLRDGTTLTVLNDWASRQYGKLMKRLHKQACGPFGTVLGPESDHFHKDHFHFDTARYRSGAYCR
ncbi:extensin-like domain-containing protein [Pseudoprimorskyibacter insulae]|uniref:Extensin-like C-terminal domain-containing protein n=1 Tax=Pseudoprimorskyibacter insulae TaxID=1695997 RepID=A0A2R8AP60_9RHOB|nr:extensin family protein [Pseudoprimorskyibacter insulae]SPF77659.1 hypothetical protein PRI8871_00243 [Pseudoprimorskyibacter insulae]